MGDPLALAGRALDATDGFDTVEDLADIAVLAEPIGPGRGGPGGLAGRGRADREPGWSGSRDWKHCLTLGRPTVGPSVHQPDLPSHAMDTEAGTHRPFTPIIPKPDHSFGCPRGS